jgi:hypothetical protein
MSEQVRKLEAIFK